MYAYTTLHICKWCTYTDTLTVCACNKYKERGKKYINDNRLLNYNLELQYIATFYVYDVSDGGSEISRIAMSYQIS